MYFPSTGTINNREIIQKYDSLHLKNLIFNNSFFELYFNKKYKQYLINLIIELKQKNIICEFGKYVTEAAQTIYLKDISELFAVIQQNDIK